MNYWRNYLNAISEGVNDFWVKEMENINMSNVRTGVRLITMVIIFGYSSLGYNENNLILASSVLNCQVTVLCFSLRFCSHARSSLWKFSRVLIRLARHCLAAGSLTDIFGIYLLYVTQAHKQRSPAFIKQLIRFFIHTDNRNVRVIRQFIDIEDILHSSNKGSIFFWRNIPVFI